jgi:hypothetical protein
VRHLNSEVAAGAIVDEGAWLGELRRELFALLAGVFAQARSRLAAFAYVGALLAEPGDRRSCWQLAEQAGHATPRRMQALLAEHRWDWTAALAALQRFIVGRLRAASSSKTRRMTCSPSSTRALDSAGPDGVTAPGFTGTPGIPNVLARIMS